MRGGEERFISKLQNYNNGEKEKGGEEDNDPSFDRKLDLMTAVAQAFVKENLLTKITRPNCQIIINYILAMQTEVSPSQTYRIGSINKLKYFVDFLIARWINLIMFI
jgi:hypothetical protein